MNLDEAIRDILNNDRPNAAREGSLVVGWVVVADWVDPDGQRWLSYTKSEGVTEWQAKGMANEVVAGGFDSEEDE